MKSVAFQGFEHAIQDAMDLLTLFDVINKKPPPPEAEVLKRSSLVMALAALEIGATDAYLAERLSGPSKAKPLRGLA